MLIYTVNFQEGNSKIPNFMIIDMFFLAHEISTVYRSFMKLMAIQRCDTHRVHSQHSLLGQLADLLENCTSVAGIGNKIICPQRSHWPLSLPVSPSASLLQESAFSCRPLAPLSARPSYMALTPGAQFPVDENLPCLRAPVVPCFESPICHPGSQMSCLPRLAAWCPLTPGLILCHCSDLYILWVLPALLVNLEMFCLPLLTALGDCGSSSCHLFRDQAPACNILGT